MPTAKSNQYPAVSRFFDDNWITLFDWTNRKQTSEPYKSRLEIIQDSSIASPDIRESNLIRNLN